MSVLKKVGLALVAPVAALVAAMAITSLVIIAVGGPPGDFWRVILSAPDDSEIVTIVNQASMLFLSGLAAAIGFRMNLFNIGVEGQYRVASYVAAVVAGAGVASGIANVLLAVLAAMATGALWAAIPAVLKVTRGVSEVISTIMLNAIAGFLVGWLLLNYGEEIGSSRRTTPIDRDTTLAGWVPFTDRDGAIWGLTVLAVLAGLAFWFVLNHTRFGFDLRATGRSESAAVASGVDVKKMVVVSMMLSGAVAGLVWLPALFHESRTPSYFAGSQFQAGLGFAGIAVALLGRNRPLGIMAGALLFAFLDAQAGDLEFERVDVSRDIVLVAQGVIVLTIVIAYEVVRRWRTRLEQRVVARTAPPPPAPGPVAEEVSA